MTAVKLLRTTSGRLYGYEISGHTGFTEAGKDIVCSALSFLSITCANALESVAGKKPSVFLHEKQGHLVVKLRETELTEQTDIIFKVFKQGISDLCAEYPRYIQTI